MIASENFAKKVVNLFKEEKIKSTLSEVVKEENEIIKSLDCKLTV